MGTIANQKDGSNIQLEIQGIGTSQASIMLQQPLLGESSENYTVEVTNFQMSLGEERATSKIYARPMMLIVDYSDEGYDFQANDPFALEPVDWTVYQDALDSGASILDAWYSTTRENADSPNDGIIQIDGIRSYSATDWVLQLSQQINLKTGGKFQMGVSSSGQFHIYSANYDLPDGTSYNKWEDHYIILDRSLQAITGWKDIIYGFGDGVVSRKLDANIENDEIFDGYNPAATKTRESLLSNQDDLAWETLDRRKRVRIDLSLPVGLTMGWKSTRQEKVFLLQEFDIPKGRPICSFNSSRDSNTASKTNVREKQLVSTTTFVNGGGNLAVQKLFPGPVQALRLNLVLVYDEFDYKKQAWVEKSKNMEMGSGDFFYLKILFSKEST